MPNEAAPLPTEDWHYWLSEDGRPMAVLNTQVPPWDPRAVVAAAPQGAVVAREASFSAAPEPFGGPAVAPEHAAEVATAQRQALLTFGAGVACFVIGAGSSIVASQSSGGGVIWTGGVLFGVVLFWRAWRLHRAAHEYGGTPSSLAKLVVGVGAVACLGLGGTALFQYFAPTEIGGAAGSCWNDSEGGMLQEVSCGADHTYKVASWVTDPDTCPLSSEFYVEVEDTDANFDCLTEDA
ncbi:hypothetical protein [Pengzhenrongella sicca]|uniref:Uncharacterized protein n=1 Tax=Pengzhenrongella sicca TaxID=2819238 RepID=A0A8A4ZEH6_9MICO|nr:hypothetical protein [Pengzhenrongella sicca]QTE30380.1 hypothetical protein J4E96_05140 [Pengzhenrongella sicca]